MLQHCKQFQSPRSGERATSPWTRTRRSVRHSAGPRRGTDRVRPYRTVLRIPALRGPPDIIVTAKGLASGFPLSGIAASGEILAKGWTGSQGGTYGGNAVACAAALATLDVIQEEGLVENARVRGSELMEATEGRSRPPGNRGGPRPWPDDRQRIASGNVGCIFEFQSASDSNARLPCVIAE
jgi:hypothetical protein